MDGAVDSNPRLSAADSIGYYERYREIVDCWAGFRASLLTPQPVTLWANPLRTTGDALVQTLRAENGCELEPIAWAPGAYRWPADAGSPGRTTAYALGHYAVQEEAALLPVRLLDPRAGERVLDLCAAPGNKTAQIAVAMQNQGTVVANDARWARLAPVRRVLERLGILNVVATVEDGAIFPDGAGRFDAVLADVPCSCDATVRKSPKVVLRQDERRRPQVRGLQRAILRRAVDLCRPGGRVVYATCTFAPEENESVVHEVLEDLGATGADDDPVLRVRPVEVPGLRLSPGLPAWQGQRFHPALARSVRLWPHHNDTGGFYVAVLDKLRGSRPLSLNPSRDGERSPSP